MVRQYEKLVRGPLALYEQMRLSVLELIRERELKPHDPIPSEGELADLFGVSRRTSKQALIMLAEEGIVYRMPRRGTFLAERAQQSDSERGKPLDAPPRIAFVVPKLDGYTGPIAEAVLAAARANGAELVLRATDNRLDEEDRLLRELASPGSGIRGVLLFPCDRKTCGTEVLRLHLEGYPIVIVDRGFREIRLPCVVHDHFRGAYDVTRMLIERGHRRIGFVSEPIYGVMSREDRYHGYIQAHSDAGVAYSMGDVRLDYADRRDADAYIAALPDLGAIFCANDHVAAEVMGAAMRAGKRVPEDVSIVGFTDLPVAAQLPVPLTTVRKSPDALGAAAAELVLSLLSSSMETRDTADAVVVPVEIVERDSVITR
ncbi:substrate-binding domain-containing protein [Cohnella sp. GCM10027633]|uniref:GntR family transcriptional regulator n=1 Tax=unclassified Cohnella TaxID=2636738 RepID=UPI003637297A